MSNVEKRKLLIIDDNQNLVSVIRQVFLKKFGWQVVDVATTGKVGLEKIAAAYASGDLYQAVLLDYNLPQMSGQKIMEHIAAQFDQQIVLIFSGTSNLNEDMARALGARGLIPKPMDLEKIEQIILDTLERK